MNPIANSNPLDELHLLADTHGNVYVKEEKGELHFIRANFLERAFGKGGCRRATQSDIQTLYGRVQAFRATQSAKSEEVTKLFATCLNRLREDKKLRKAVEEIREKER